MLRNYHTHTYRCHHASGTEREYIEEGIQNGLIFLGFSDHTPQNYPSWYKAYPSRMSFEEAPEYFATLRALREEYKDRIEITIGFETEYFPALFDEYIELIGQLGCEYIILGQHSTNNEYDGESSFVPTESEQVLSDYTDNVIGAIESGRFTYIAHPDVMYFTGKDRIYRKYAEALCKSAKAHEVPLEINLLGLENHRHYPRDLFWEVAKDVGNTIVLGCDAHDIAAVAGKSRVQPGLDFIERMGLTVTDRIPLINPLTREKTWPK